MNTDKLTSISGFALAILQAGQVALTQLPAGSVMTSKEWLAVGMAALFAALGFFTNKSGSISVVTKAE